MVPAEELRAAVVVEMGMEIEVEVEKGRSISSIQYDLSGKSLTSIPLCLLPG